MKKSILFLFVSIQFFLLNLNSTLAQHQNSPYDKLQISAYLDIKSPQYSTNDHFLTQIRYVTEFLINELSKAYDPSQKNKHKSSQKIKPEFFSDFIHSLLFVRYMLETTISHQNIEGPSLTNFNEYEISTFKYLQKKIDNFFLTKLENWLSKEGKDPHLKEFLSKNYNQISFVHFLLYPNSRENSFLRKSQFKNIFDKIKNLSFIDVDRTTGQIILHLNRQERLAIKVDPNGKRIVPLIFIPRLVIDDIPFTQMKYVHTLEEAPGAKTKKMDTQDPVSALKDTTEKEVNPQSVEQTLLFLLDELSKFKSPRTANSRSSEYGKGKLQFTVEIDAIGNLVFYPGFTTGEFSDREMHRILLNDLISQGFDPLASLSLSSTAITNKISDGDLPKLKPIIFSIPPSHFSEGGINETNLLLSIPTKFFIHSSLLSNLQYSLLLGIDPNKIKESNFRIYYNGGIYEIKEVLISLANLKKILASDTSKIEKRENPFPKYFKINIPIASSTDLDVVPVEDFFNNSENGFITSVKEEAYDFKNSKKPLPKIAEKGFFITPEDINLIQEGKGIIRFSFVNFSWQRELLQSKYKITYFSPLTQKEKKTYLDHYKTKTKALKKKFKDEKNAINLLAKLLDTSLQRIAIQYLLQDHSPETNSQKIFYLNNMLQIKPQNSMTTKDHQQNFSDIEKEAYNYMLNLSNKKGWLFLYKDGSYLPDDNIELSRGTEHITRFIEKKIFIFIDETGQVSLFQRKEKKYNKRSARSRTGTTQSPNMHIRNTAHDNPSDWTAHSDWTALKLGHYEQLNLENLRLRQSIRHDPRSIRNALAESPVYFELYLSQIIQCITLL